MKVTLINLPQVAASQSISHGARTCYEPETPDINTSPINIRTNLWNVGHHTTAQHDHFSFSIEGISVGDVTLGLHLANPFYNTGQRSGRFCTTMFANPDIEEILAYITQYYDVKRFIPEIREYLRVSYGTYGRFIESATRIAGKYISEERPRATQKYIDQNAPKFAQEQMRMFIPVIFPTALRFTINISALAALYQNAWSPVLKDATQQMVDAVLARNPELGFMFARADYDFANLPIERTLTTYGIVQYKPTAFITSLGNPDKFVVPELRDMFPVDSLPFNPKFMDNNCEELKSEVEISLATMGQDQRHRTIRRSRPQFTGKFYLPPVLRKIGLEREALSLMRRWRSLFLNKEIPLPLACSLAPYGAMVRYEKSASYNALAHEMLKRLCWCAQEEIYHLAVATISQIPENSRLGSFVKAPCALSGVCGEGKRYCGRDIKKSSLNPERNI